MKKNLGKIIYCFTSFMIPIIIIFFAGIYKGIEAKTATFLVITSVMYIVGLKLISPILNIRQEFSDIIDTYNADNSKEGLTADKKYRKFIGIIKNYDSKFVKLPFEEYGKTLKKVKGEIDEFGQDTVTYYSTNDIEYYFEEDNIIYKNIYSRTITQITQGLTAVGIFGTFLGIVEGVSKLDLSSSDAMKVGIATLLSGVKTSFNSSLYGILFSVILTFALKIVVDMTMRKIDEFCSIVNGLINPYTEQSALSDLECELKKQTSTFEQLATTLVEEMSKNFEQSIQNNLECLSNNINDIIGEMQGKLANSINDNTAQTIVGLTATMQPVLEKLESTISSFEVNQQQTTGKFFEESISSIKDAINVGTSDEVTRLRESMDAISEKNADMLETFKTSMESMKELTLHQESLLKNTTSSTESMNMTTDNIRELQSDLSKVILSIKDVNNTSNVSLENIKDTVNSIQSSVSKQLEASSIIDEMLIKSNRLGESQEKYISKFESLAYSMTNAIEGTQNMMNNLNSEIKSYKNYFDNIKNSTLEVASTLDLKYKNITDNVEIANKNLVNTVEAVKVNILDKVNVTGDKLYEVSSSLNNFQNKAAELINKFEKFAEVEESTQELWMHYKDSFDSLNNHINEGVVNYTKSISDGVNTLFTEYDTSISNAVTGLKKMVEVLNDSADNIAEALEAVGNNSNGAEVL